MTNYELLQLSEKLSKDQYLGVLVHDTKTGKQRVLRIQGVTKHPPARNANPDTSNWLVSLSVSEDDSTIPADQMGDDAIPGYLASLEPQNTPETATETVSEAAAEPVATVELESTPGPVVVTPVEAETATEPPVPTPHPETPRKPSGRTGRK